MNKLFSFCAALSVGLVAMATEPTNTGTLTIQTDAKERLQNASNGIRNVELPPDVLAEDVTINRTEATLCNGSSCHLVATVLPNDSSDQDFIWTSSNTDVAEVDDDGLVTAVGVGTATITASLANYGDDMTVTCNVTVSPAPYTLTYRTHLLGAITWDVAEGSTYTLTIDNPGEYVVHSIAWNGEDMKSQFTADNTFTTPAITQNSELSVVFQTGTGADKTNADKSEVKVLAHNGQITVLGAAAGEQIICINADGVIEQSIQATMPKEVITLTQGKMYVVKVGNRTFKAML